MSSGRCSVHNLACGPDGQCALCHRARPGERAGATHLVIGALGVLSLVVSGAFAFRGLRGVASAVRDRAAAEAATDADGAPKSLVRLYTTSWCPHCSRAKQWLAAQHVEYAELDVEHDTWARREHRRLNPRGSVPTFDAYGEIVQGFNPESFQAALRRGAARQGP